ncbi:hypothetical protein M3175_18530 [Robertmurraya korlensis]|uniref:hypothetical protein n=1 Tax=Robertmurraya korlensis TaxID=519977 RepID=UPI002040A3EA|nr:hypothetical protein [Robertmurraya korlensis]MCM3602736.1 hypothetical protein [Robertmurraya korlensis]
MYDLVSKLFSVTGEYEFESFLVVILLFLGFFFLLKKWPRYIKLLDKQIKEEEDKKGKAVNKRIFHIFNVLIVTLVLFIIIRQVTLVPYYNDRAEEIIKEWNKDGSVAERIENGKEKVYFDSVSVVGRRSSNQQTMENILYKEEKDRDIWEYVYIRGDKLINPQKELFFNGLGEFIKIRAKVFEDPSIEKPYMTYTYIDKEDVFWLKGYYDVEVYTNDLRND